MRSTRALAQCAQGVSVAEAAFALCKRAAGEPGEERPEVLCIHTLFDLQGIAHIADLYQSILDKFTAEKALAQFVPVVLWFTNVHGTFAEAVADARSLEHVALRCVGAEEAESSTGTVRVPVLQQAEYVGFGGTFDRLHAGHCVLLTAAALSTSKSLVVGVAADELLQNKQYRELLQSWEERAARVVAFCRLAAAHKRPHGVLDDVYSGECNDVEHEHVFRAYPLRTVAGHVPTAARLDVLVASDETARGAHALVDQRNAAGRSAARVLVVPCVAPAGSEAKLSSTGVRASEAALRDGNQHA